MSTVPNIKITDALINNRTKIAEIFANALYQSPRWVRALQNAQSNWAEFLEDEFYVYVDYLAKYFSTGDDTFKFLFLGEKLKSLYDASLNQEERKAVATNVHTAEMQALEGALKGALGEDWDSLVTELNKLYKLLIADTKNKKRILFIGDCLFLDILPFVVAPLIGDDISIHVDYVTSKNPFEMRDEIKQFSEQKIDLVFYSPFTYDFSADLLGITNWKNCLASKQNILEDLKAAWQETEKSIAVVSDLFDCPVYLHNASFPVREENPLKRRMKLWLTSRHRKTAQQWLDHKINESVISINQATFPHFFVFDELKSLAGLSDFDAGAMLHNSKLQHPSVLGKTFSKEYQDIIFSAVFLAKKKLVVCDLDNTLWDGVIGEGAVAHFHDRQSLLKSLKKKGVILAINSKNDPANVHWTNATLNEDDFVASAISWMPKIHGMATIQSELNLKMNSFVFVDDRADELELMSSTYPEILCLNAKDPKTWARIKLWQASLEDDLDMDRTEMYKQRELRKAFVKEDVSDEQEKAKLFASLELKLVIKRPELSDLKRVTELINRTNQFNLEGTRLNLKDMTDWYHNDNYMILCGRTSDRFGDMGITCVAVGGYENQQFNIIAFVLSCRVFGYHFEHSVMNYIKQFARNKGALKMKANYVATAQNAPCKNFLPDCEFEQNAHDYTFDLTKPIQPNASWLLVESN
jgi:FkbH-like protein